MSIKAMSAVLNADLKTAARNSIMLAIADAANDDGKGSFQSYETIAKKACVSRSTAISNCKKLLAEGLLILTGKRSCSQGFTNNFAINLDELSRMSYVEGVREQDPTSPRAGPHQSESWTPPVRELDPTSPRAGPKPSLNPVLVVVEGAREEKPNLEIDLDTLKTCLTEWAGDCVDWNHHAIAILREPLSWLTGENAAVFDDLQYALNQVRAQREGESEKLTSWNYFRKAVFRARDRRLTPNPEPQIIHESRTNERNYSNSETIVDDAFRKARELRLASGT